MFINLHGNQKRDSEREIYIYAHIYRFNSPYIMSKCQLALAKSNKEEKNDTQKSDDFRFGSVRYL